MMQETRHIIGPPTPPRQHLLRHREQIGWHDHAWHHIAYPRSGVLAVSTSVGSWVVPPGRAIWLPAWVPHAHQAHGVTDMRSLTFPAEVNPLGATQPTVLSVSPLLREAIIVLTGREQPAGREREHIEQVVLDQLRPLPLSPLYLPEPADDRLRRISAMLRADPPDTRTLAQLGAEVGAGERTLSRLFRQQTGMTFPQWRAQVRLHHALRELTAGTPVTAAAHGCGYANASAFIDAFRQAFGMTPGAYQASLRH